MEIPDTGAALWHHGLFAAAITLQVQVALEGQYDSNGIVAAVDADEILQVCHSSAALRRMPSPTLGQHDTASAICALSPKGPSTLLYGSERSESLVGPCCVALDEAPRLRQSGSLGT